MTVLAIFYLHKSAGPNGRIPPVASIARGKIERIPCISFAVVPRWSHRRQLLSETTGHDFHSLFTFPTLSTAS